MRPRAGRNAGRPPAVRPAGARLGGAATVALLTLAACGGDASGDGAADAAPGARSEGGLDAATPTPLPPVEVGGLRVSRVVAPRPPAGERTALYLVVRDLAGAGDALVGLEADGVDDAGLHRTVEQDGRATMGPADSLPVPAGGEARLAPGGFHGMLEGLGRTLEAGDTLAVRLRFRGAGEVPVRALVVPYAALDALFPPPGEPAAHDGHGGEG